MEKVFITRRLQPIARELLSKKFKVEENSTDILLSREELKRIVLEYDAVLTTLADKIDADLLYQKGRLKVISNCAAGVDNIDVAAAKKAKVAILNLPDIVTESTADLTLALFLAFVRKIAEGQRYVREGKWRTWEPGLLLGEELSGKSFGIIGYGKIGKAVAKRAIAFGMKIAVVHRRPIVFEDGRMEQVSLEKFCEEVDYVSLHVPLTKETLHMIDLPLMKKMRKQPILINMARGGVIKTDDLVLALKKGIIRGAALDVTDPEPLPAAHPLCHLDNCMVLPHIGSATIECRTLMARKAAENLLGFFYDQ